MTVAGCDVAGGRWIAVVLDDAGAFASAFVAASLAEVAGACADAAALAVDIPIGLPVAGPRAADLAGRELLGARRSTLFVTPVRAAVEEPDHARAVALNRRATGAGVSRQAHGLRGMILDAEAVAASDARVHEAHPELSFAAMAGGAPVAASKRSWDGLRARLALLRGVGIVLPAPLGAAGRVAPDDVVDAAAVAWTASRIAGGRARRLGEPGGASRDCAIWV